MNSVKKIQYRSAAEILLDDEMKLVVGGNYGGYGGNEFHSFCWECRVGDYTRGGMCGTYGTFAKVQDECLDVFADVCIYGGFFGLCSNFPDGWDDKYF